MTNQISTTFDKLKSINKNIETLQEKTTNFLQNYSNGNDFFSLYQPDNQKKKTNGEIMLDKVDKSYKKLDEIIQLTKEMKDEFERRFNNFIE